MAYESETYEEVLQRMLDRMADDLDKREGSVIQDLLSPAALEIAQMYFELGNQQSFIFASEDMPSDLLDLRTQELGVFRKAAERAIGELTFIGDNGYVIPAGSQLASNSVDPIYFETLEAATIANGTVTVNARAVTGGVAGNVEPNSITVVSSNLTGVESVTNANAFSEGVNAESDSELLARYYEKVRRPATSGNVYQYEQWAKSVEGIGDARVFPLWDGNGTVKVIVASNERRTPTAEKITEVHNYIESQQPIGARLTTKGATEFTVSVSAKVALESDILIGNIINQYTTLVNNYIKSIPFGDVISYAKIGALLLSIDGIIDYSDLLVNGGTANLDMVDEQIAVLNGMSLTKSNIS